MSSVLKYQGWYLLQNHKTPEWLLEAAHLIHCMITSSLEMAHVIIHEVQAGVMCIPL